MGRGVGLKGQICVYCNERQSTRNGDHLFARSLLAVAARNGAPKLPCCELCNRDKAKLEHYLASTLPLASREHDAVKRANLAASRAIKNLPLARSMISGAVTIIDPIEGGRQETLAFPFEPEIVLAYAKLLTIGLLYWATKTRVADPHSIRTFFAEKDHDNALVWEFLYNTDGVKVRGNIGGAGLTFDGICNGDIHTLSAWRLSLLNGVCFTQKNRKYSNAIWSVVAFDNAE